MTGMLKSDIFTRFFGSGGKLFFSHFNSPLPEPLYDGRVGKSRLSTCSPSSPSNELPSRTSTQTVIQRAAGVNPVLAVHTSPARRISLVNLLTQSTNHYSLLQEILQSLSLLLNDGMAGSILTSWLY